MSEQLVGLGPAQIKLGDFGLRVGDHRRRIAFFTLAGPGGHRRFVETDLVFLGVAFDHLPAFGEVVEGGLREPGQPLTQSHAVRLLLQLVEGLRIEPR